MMQADAAEERHEREIEPIEPEVLEGSLVPISSPFGMVVQVEDETSRHIAWDSVRRAWLQSVRPNSAKAYDTAYRQFVEDFGVHPWEATPYIAHEWVMWLRDDLGLSEASINAKLAAMTSFFAFVQNNYTTRSPNGRSEVSLWPYRNPFTAVKRRKLSPYGRAVFPSRREMHKIFSEIQHNSLVGKRDYALLLSYYVSCRRASEILNLKWGDLQETAEGDFVFSYVYKGGVEKRGILKRVCYVAICEYLRADGRPPDEMQSDDYIFIPLNYAQNRHKRLNGADAETNRNHPISNRQANDILKKYARRAGVDERKVHIHGLRHAGARLRIMQMKERGKPIDYQEIMNLLGHSNLSITQVYIQEVLEDPVDDGGAEVASEVEAVRNGQMKLDGF